MIEWTTDQFSFIQFVAQPSAERNPKTEQEFAELIGVSERVLYKWKKLDGFYEEVVKERQKYFKHNQTTDILGALVKQCKKGDAAAIRLYLQYMEDFAEKKDETHRFIEELEGMTYEAPGSTESLPEDRGMGSEPLAENSDGIGSEIQDDSSWTPIR